MPEVIKLRKGLDIKLKGTAEKELVSVKASKQYALVPDDFVGVTPKVVVADTVGAGDSFTGSFIASILKGKSIPEAHKRAVEVSAYVCTQNGAMPVLPENLLQ